MRILDSIQYSSISMGKGILSLPHSHKIAVARPVHRETEVKSTGNENGGSDKGHIPIIETDP